MPNLPIRLLAGTVFLLTAVALPATAGEVPSRWQQAWPETDFSRVDVDVTQIRSGGVPRDAIPSIDDPRYVALDAVDNLAGTEPVIGITSGGKARAYPLRVLTWHEIVNDTFDGRPLAVTYCPLCNTAVVFDRTVGGEPVEFGVSGMLRNSDLIMYDRASHTWWQQYSGRAIIGEKVGTTLETVPSRLESFARFRERVSAAGLEAEVLVPSDPDMRPYGVNPYVGYDSAAWPFLFNGEVPERVFPMEYVVAVGNRAWSLEVLKDVGTIVEDGLELNWTPGKNSALDTRNIAEGQDIGNITVTRDGADVAYHVTFAFVFFAFTPDGLLTTPLGDRSWPEQDRG